MFKLVQNNGLVYMTMAFLYHLCERDELRWLGVFFVCLFVVFLDGEAGVVPCYNDKKHVCVINDNGDYKTGKSDKTWLFWSFFQFTSIFHIIYMFFIATISPIHPSSIPVS